MRIEAERLREKDEDARANELLRRQAIEEEQRLEKIEAENKLKLQRQLDQQLWEKKHKMQMQAVQKEDVSLHPKMIQKYM